MGTLTGIYIGAAQASGNTGNGTHTGINIGASQHEDTGAPISEIEAPDVSTPAWTQEAPAVETESEIAAPDVSTPAWNQEDPELVVDSAVTAPDANIPAWTQEDPGLDVGSQVGAPDVSIPAWNQEDPALLSDAFVTCSDEILNPWNQENPILTSAVEIAADDVNLTPWVDEQPVLDSAVPVVADDVNLPEWTQEAPTLNSVVPPISAPDVNLTAWVDEQPVLTSGLKTGIVAALLPVTGTPVPPPMQLSMGMNGNPPEDIDPQPSKNYGPAGHWLNDWDNRNLPPLDPLSDADAGELPIWASVPVKAKAGEQYTVFIQDLEVEIQNHGTHTSSTVINFTADTSALTFTVHQHLGPEANRVLDIRHPSQIANESYFDTRYINSGNTHKGQRGLNWNNTNRSTVVSASDRIPYTHYCQGSPALRANERLFLDYCTECQCDAWLTLPRLVDSTYIDAVAQDCIGWIADNPAKTLRLEYGNEAWNNQFEIYDYMLQLAAIFGFNDTLDKTKVARAYGKTAATMHKLFDAHGFPYRRVVCWQAADGGSSNQALLDEYVNEYGAPPQDWGTAPYILIKFEKDIIRPIQIEEAPAAYAIHGLSLNASHLSPAENAAVEARLLADWTQDDLIFRVEFEPTDGLQRAIPWVYFHNAFALANGMIPVWYEGGNHLIFNIANYNEYQTWVNNHYWPTFDRPEWTSIYNKIYTEHNNTGGGDAYFLSQFQIRRDSAGFGHETFLSETAGGLNSNEQLRIALNQLG